MGRLRTQRPGTKITRSAVKICCNVVPTQRHVIFTGLFEQPLTI